MLVEKKLQLLPKSFITEAGIALPTPVVAYEEYGNHGGRTILLCHGGLSSCHAAGKYSGSDPLPGWWDGMIGPGLAFDTNRFHIVSVNALGSMYGTTGPGSIDPATARPSLSLRCAIR
jgi:homoserine O-acetyltransferase